MFLYLQNKGIENRNGISDSGNFYEGSEYIQEGLNISIMTNLLKDLEQISDIAEIYSYYALFLFVCLKCFTIK